MKWSDFKITWVIPLLAVASLTGQAAPQAMPDISASVVGIVELNRGTIRDPTIKSDDQAIEQEISNKPSTGFFIDPGGLILTNAHVVYRAFTDPTHWPVIVVLVGREWYSAKIVCSSASSPGPTVAELTMDQAVLRIAPAFTDEPWGLLPYQPHLGPLPAFPALTLAKHSPQGTAVRTTGWGSMSPLLRLFTTDGQITRTFPGWDGIPYVEATFSNPPLFGSSGSPIVDSNGTVVGMIQGFNPRDRHVYAISASALSATCGK